MKEENIQPHFYDRRLYKSPTNSELCLLLWKKLRQKFQRKWEDIFFFNQWFLLYDIREGMSTSLWRFKHIMPPKDRFWADPFIIARDNKYFIFIEELLYSTQKGHISVIVMDKSGAFVWLTNEANTLAHRSWIKPASVPGWIDWQYAEFAA